MAAEEKTEEKKAKKKTKPRIRKGSYYDVSKGVERKRKSCPKCGAGVFMARHADRSTCGSCGYTEFAKKKTES